MDISATATTILGARLSAQQEEVAVSAIKRQAEADKSVVSLIANAVDTTTYNANGVVPPSSAGASLEARA